MRYNFKDGSNPISTQIPTYQAQVSFVKKPNKQQCNKFSILELKKKNSFQGSKTTTGKPKNIYPVEISDPNASINHQLKQITNGSSSKLLKKRKIIQIATPNKKKTKRN